MSGGKRYLTSEFPLPYVEKDIRQWPIYKLSEDRDNFMESVKSETRRHFLGKLGSKPLRDELKSILFQERNRLIEKPWKADPKDEGRFWSGVKSKIIRLDSPGSGITEEQILEEIMERYVQEITGNFDPGAFNMARTVLPFFFSRVLSASPGKWAKTLSANWKTLHEKIPIIGDIEKIRKLSEKHTIVVVPTHFSNMDSIMIGWVLNELGLPAFTYGAGLNLFSIKLLSYFMSRLGAYKVDRRKKNGLYLEMLKTYSRIALQRGAHSIFFPGGTRSRSGQLEKKLKLGLLGTAVEAQRNHFMNYEDEQNAPRIFVVPLIINYHFVLEAEGLISDYLKETGKEKYLRENDEYSTSVKMLKFIYKFIQASSSLTISLGEVMDVVGNRVDEQGRSFDHLGREIHLREYFMTNRVMVDDPQRDGEYTRILSEKIVQSYYRNNVVLDSHLVCYTAFELIRRKYKAEDIFALFRIPPDDIRLEKEEFNQALRNVIERLRFIESREEVILSREIDPANLNELIANGIRNIALYHIQSPLVQYPDGQIGTENMKLLYYYHNRLEGYNLQYYVG